MPDPVCRDGEDEEGHEGGEDEMASQMGPLRHGARHSYRDEGAHNSVHNPFTAEEANFGNISGIIYRIHLYEDGDTRAKVR